jgi:hypothetical protein
VESLRGEPTDYLTPLIPPLRGVGQKSPDCVVGPPVPPESAMMAAPSAPGRHAPHLVQEHKGQAAPQLHSDVKTQSDTMKASGLDGQAGRPWPAARALTAIRASGGGGGFPVWARQTPPPTADPNPPPKRASLGTRQRPPKKTLKILLHSVGCGVVQEVQQNGPYATDYGLN